MVIGSDFNMNKTDIHNNDFARRLALKERLSELGNGLLFTLGAILIYPTGREELYFVTVTNKYETRKWSIVFFGSHPLLSHGKRGIVLINTKKYKH